MNSPAPRTAFIGQSVATSKRSVRVSAGLFVFAVVVVLGSMLLDVSVGRYVSGDAMFTLAFVALAAFAGENAARRGGLLASWALVFAPVCAWFVVVLSAISPATVAAIPVVLGKSVLIGAAFALVVGSVGHALGVGYRRYVARRG